MEFLSECKKLVEKVYSDLQEYTEIYNREASEVRMKLFEEAKAKFAEDPDSVNLEELARETLFMGSFQQTDIRRMQVKLILIYNIYYELGGEEKFSEDLEKAVQFLKASLPKQIFVAKNGKLEEVEAGSVDKLRENYDTRGLFQMFKPTIESLLNEQ